MKIVELRAENVKRLKAVEITPDGTLQVIGGRNAQGKSSVLDAIWLALAEKVRDGMHTVEMARTAVRAGMSVGEVYAWDAALEEAALLIEEVEL